MKKREIQELKTKPMPELMKLLKEWKERLRVLKFDLAAGKVKDIQEIKAVKKSIAQILTILSEISRRENAAKKSQ